MPTRCAALAAGCLASVIVLAGCSSSSSSTRGASPASSAASTASMASQCLDAPAAAITAISAGLRDGATALSGGKAVAVVAADRVSGGYPTYVVAAMITTGLDGTWAIGGTLDHPTSIIALNEAARTYTDWGSGIKAGSAADRQRTRLMGLDETGVSTGCIGEE